MTGNRKLFLATVGLFLAGSLVTWFYGYFDQYALGVTLVLLGVALGAGFLSLAKPHSPQITERFTRRNLLEDLRQSQERLQLVIEGTNDGIWDWDIATDHVFWSERANLLADNGGCGFGNSWSALKKMMLGGEKERFDQALRAHMLGNLPFSVEIRIQCGDHGSRTLLIRGKVKRDANGIPVRMAGSVSDITTAKDAEQELIYKAYHDELTGVGNRRMFMDRLDHNLHKAFRRPGYLFVVMMMDIDHFKEINDTFGHTMGDQIMRQMTFRIAEVLKEVGRPELIARMGGDEFGVILEDLRHVQDEALHVAARIQEELSEPYVLDGKQILTSVSMGLVFNGVKKDDSEKRENKEEILANADTVLQTAKRNGRNRCEIFTTGMREKALELYRLSRDLHQALDEEKLSLVYQPIMNAFSGKIDGFEALVRWNLEPGKDISPSAFIPMAEENGLIFPLGKWILRKACEQAKIWVDSGYSDLTVSVNFSAKQFIAQDVAQMIESILETTGLPSRNLKVEITETTTMQEVQRTVDTLRDLSNMGLHISIDDFGTGYSSLGYLKKFPIDTLKIDRTFVQDLPYDQDDIAITRTIIAMANSLRLNIVAEGVETQEQLHFLQGEGCQLIQGFYFSKPLTIDDATEFLKEYAA